MGVLIQGFMVPVKGSFFSVNFPFLPYSNVKRESPHSLELVSIVVGLVDSICHLQVKFLGEIFQEIQLTVRSTVRHEFFKG